MNLLAFIKKMNAMNMIKKVKFSTNLKKIILVSIII